MSASINKRIPGFQRKVLRFYERHGRSFPWRETKDPYCIWLSEVMLQQTQTDRVRTKYVEFLQTFPTVAALAKASPAAVLKLWSGLGYNRRALNLQRAAKLISEKFDGQFPKEPETLELLPGVGAYTASAVACFAWGFPAVFIETNIRSVFIHEFFADNAQVSDSELMPIIECAVYRKDPRRWYYALMDYGVYLKKRHPGIGRRSKHYVRQSPFKGSRRQLRGRVLKHLTLSHRATIAALSKEIGAKKEALLPIVEALRAEGFVSARGRQYQLTQDEHYEK